MNFAGLAEALVFLYDRSGKIAAILDFGSLMSIESASDYSPQLKQLMHQAGYMSYASLMRTTGLSRTHILWLRQGRILDLPMAKGLLLSQALNIELDILLSKLSANVSVNLRRMQNPDLSNQQTSVNSRKRSNFSDQEYLQVQQKLETLTQEYRHLQKQLQIQPAQLQLEHQKATLQALESLLLQWPTAAYAARKNPEAPAIKLLPLLRPLEQLLASWGVSPIGEVGAEIAYNPQWHQVMPTGDQGLINGDLVRVRYVGYRQGEQLLYRAKVSPL